MTTNSTTAEHRLAKLGIHLSDAPTPFDADMDFKSLISTNIEGFLVRFCRRSIAICN